MSWWEDFIKSMSAGAGAAGGGNGGAYFSPETLQGLNQTGANFARVAGERDPGATSGVSGVARKAVEQMIRTDGTLTEEQYTLLQQWLAGGDLADPRLIAKVMDATMGQPVEGAGRIAGAPGQEPGTRPASPLNDGSIPFSQPATSAVRAATAPATGAPPVPNLPNTGNAGAAGGGGTTPTTPAAPGVLASDAGETLLEDREGLMRYIQRQAGLNPERGGMASEFFAQQHKPVINALATLYGDLPGQGDIDYGQVGNNFANFGKAFITPGQSGYGLARQYAGQIAGSADFGEMLGGVTDGEQMGYLENLMHLKNAGARGLKASWTARQMENLKNRYQDSEMGLMGGAIGQYGGNFTKMLAENPELARRLFGYTPR